MQIIINKILQSHLDRFAIIYMDDILVYSDTKNEHVKHVKMVLNVLKQKKLKIRTEICEFHVQKITVLGFVITPKKHLNGNDQNRQYPNLTDIQKHKKFAKIVGIYKILPKHDTKICRMNIINDISFIKKEKN